MKEIEELLEDYLYLMKGKQYPESDESLIERTEAILPRIMKGEFDNKEVKELIKFKELNQKFNIHTLEVKRRMDKEMKELTDGISEYMAKIVVKTARVVELETALKEIYEAIERSTFNNTIAVVHKILSKVKDEV